ncbi:LAME_0F04346g1_1 [Lachancea meyersii CBS 8951]|uniref:LAME_0F04346g1_1 n=1 Tax=Lachancea meyersii CBS 8951 TaxID=1266667 RepID=A0A1G4JS10_9SACH|nr:LAME_0F04346g1_1 [Lachancea meyersii CBS 8951]
MAKGKKKAGKASGTPKKPAEPELVDSETKTTSDSILEDQASNMEEVLDDEPGASIEDDNKQLNGEILRLQKEIAELRVQVQSQPETNGADENLSAKLAQVQEERDHFEHQYDSLLDRLSSMKSVFSKMRESQEELDSCQEQLREYESQNLSLRNKVDSTKRENEELRTLTGTLNQELSGLDAENEKLSHKCSEAEDQNTIFAEDIDRLKRDHQREKEQLVAENEELELVLNNLKHDSTVTKEELEDTTQRLQKIELAKTKIEKELADLKTQFEQEQLENVRNGTEKDNLIQELTTKLEEAQQSNEKTQQELATSQSQAAAMKNDVSQKEALQQECKEKVLQIGKLRHEAIILNEHLTKALAMLKKSSDSENVDKELISNLLISFVSIPRADPKKFEVLELISSFLNWDDDKKQQAGLIHSANGTKPASGGSRTQNFVSLWTEFLEKESEK